MRNHWKAWLLFLALALAAATSALAAVGLDKMIGGTWDFGEGSYWTEADTTAPTLATDGFKLSSESHRGPANRVTLLVDLGTRETWGFRVFCYNATASGSNNAGWFQIEPAVITSLSVAVAAKNITATVSADTLVPFELGAHCSRIDLQHAAVSGATATTPARAYVIGN